MYKSGPGALQYPAFVGICCLPVSNSLLRRAATLAQRNPADTVSLRYTAAGISAAYLDVRHIEALFQLSVKDVFVGGLSYRSIGRGLIPKPTEMLIQHVYTISSPTNKIIYPTVSTIAKRLIGNSNPKHYSWCPI